MKIFILFSRAGQSESRLDRCWTTFFSNWNCPKKVIEISYTSLVRPKLEHASAAWDPFLKKDISALERVQRKAARFCSQNYDRYASVTDMIKDLARAVGHAGNDKKAV